MKTKVKRAWDPSNWAGLKPFGIGEQRPNNYWEIVRAAIENRDRLPYAWRILNRGVCDGCALGTTGMKDWTLDGTHLCNIRLRLLRLNTIGPLDPARLSDVSALENLSNAELREMGRIPAPMIRERGDAGFRTIGWDEALDLIARRIERSAPERLGFYLTSRGIPNETYYAVQKAARALGTNNIDNAARICHSPSTSGLKNSLGVAATTCSYRDWIESDLIVFIGSNVANNQPVATKYLHYARKNGAKIAVINSYREPGMEQYWIPSIPESALFGTRLTHRFFLIDTGGDIAFLNGALKHIVDNAMFDPNFVENKTAGFEKLRASLEKQSWAELERLSGAARIEMQSFAQMVADARRAVFVWSMGITQHVCGEDNVQAIINLALTRGFVGRAGCGLMPIRGHSGVQGGAEMGCYASVFPGGRPVNGEEAEKLAEHWGFSVPAARGLTAPEMIDAAHEGAMDVLFSVGGNFLDVLPDPDFVREALERVPLRVHMDIVPSRQMFTAPGEIAILLPAMTRYEIPGGVTQTSTERRVIFSPEIPGPRIPEARPEFEAALELARRVKPEIADRLRFAGASAIREEIARVIPLYDGIQNLNRRGDQFQYGGPHLCKDWNFPTPDGKAHFRPVEPASSPLPEGAFRVATRRGKQFNSMVHESLDSITGAEREAVLVNAEDAGSLSLCNGQAVEVYNDLGRVRGRIALAPVKRGNLQLHWPEGNVLIDRRRRSPEAGIPDFNAVAWIRPFDDVSSVE